MRRSYFYTITLALVMLVMASAGASAQTRIRIDGYRVQIYSGGNTRQAKSEAQQMARRAEIWFADQHNVYTHFASPHWVCRVGDFKSRYEAQQLLTEMRQSKRFPGAVIVKSKINIRTDELRKETPDSCSAGAPTAYTPHP